MIAFFGGIAADLSLILNFTRVLFVFFWKALRSQHNSSILIYTFFHS
jgi:hypothetical protein